MGMYIYGIAISAFMIVSGVVGLASGEGSIMSVALTVVGAIFLVIDIVLLLRARKNG